VLAATAGGRTLFAAPAHGSPDNLLWATEGTAAGTLRLTPPGVTVYGSLLAASQRVFFFATDAEHGTELWASDGTPASTHLVADLAPGPESVQADFNTLTVLRGQVIFRRLDDDTHFWTTDGTAAGTRRLIDVYPFLDSFEGEYFPVFAESSGILFFVPSHGEDHPHEVWVSDWTSEGTHLLGRPDTAVSVIAIFSAGSRLFVGTAPTRTNDVEPAGLWVQNGSPTGFVRVPATVSFHLGTTPIAFGDRLVFADGSEKISVTDGSPAGTFPLLDPAGEEISLGGVGHVASFAGSLVFAGNDPGPCTIWDGTGNVAAPAADVQCGGGFFPVGSRLFFTGIAPQTGAELWAFEEP
jgi:ELWxxDGT repeat protein